MTVTWMESGMSSRQLTDEVKPWCFHIELVLSSFLFIIPIIVAFFLDLPLLTIAFSTLFITNFYAYLGQHQALKWLDRIVASSLTVGLTLIAIVCGTGALSAFAAVCGIYAMVLYCKSKKPQNEIDISCHVTMHFVGAIGFVLFAFAVHRGDIIV